MTERRLRAVGAGEKAPAKRGPRKAAPKSVVEAVRSGDRRTLLVALQARIARELDSPATSGPAFAALAKRLTDLATEIQAIDAAAEAAATGPGGAKSVIADTPNEAWDESMI